VEEDPDAIWEPAENDVLSGRGASVNGHAGNKRFRALCFARKPWFEAGNPAAKRRISVEIVKHAQSEYGSRFLRKMQGKGPWYEMAFEQAVLKASQIMRDHRRPDRLARRELLAAAATAAGRKRSHLTSTPMEGIDVEPPPAEPLVEMPPGIHDHDVLCGRGAFVNGHTGNQRMRKLAIERKPQFDNATFSVKRNLATEIVNVIKGLDPPGRFLRSTKYTSVQAVPSTTGMDGAWEELTTEKAIHKTIQVMRDIDRADRRDRDEKRRLKKSSKQTKVVEGSKDVDTNPTTQSTEYVVEQAIAALESNEAFPSASGHTKTGGTLTEQV
jgi:hypothetical protein